MPGTKTREMIATIRTSGNPNPSPWAFDWGKASWFPTVSGHRGRGAVDQHDPAALPEPGVGGTVLELLGGLTDQALDDRQREAPVCVAVAAGVRRAGLATIDRQP